MKLSCSLLTRVGLLAATLSFCLSASASAAFILVEDFNALSDGAINGQNGWNANSASIDVTSSIPFSASDKGLNNGGTSTNAYKSFGTIADGDTGTVFFQLHASDLLTPGTSFGVADSSIDSGSPFPSYRSQLAFSGTDSSFAARNGGSSVTVDQSLEEDTFYNIWMVIDNASDSTQYYIQGGAFVTQTQLTGNSGAVTSFAFRSDESSAASISNFLIAKGGGATSDSIFFDNIYFDSGVNLTNPIPEPSGVTLLGLGAVLLFRVRRRSAR